MNPEAQEKLPIEISQVQFDTLHEGAVGSPELEALRGELGIEYNSGNIAILVDGKKTTVTTAQNDFFTVIDTEGRIAREALQDLDTELEMPRE